MSSQKGQSIHNYFSKEFLDELCSWLGVQEGVEIEYTHATNFISERVGFFASKGDTYIYMTIFDHTELNFKYVVLNNQRVGTFTEFVRRIIEKLRGSSIRCVKVESVISGEMLKWCQKNGFGPSVREEPSSDGLGVSYIKKL